MADVLTEIDARDAMREAIAVAEQAKVETQLVYEADDPAWLAALDTVLGVLMHLRLMRGVHDTAWGKALEAYVAAEGVLTLLDLLVDVLAEAEPDPDPCIVCGHRQSDHEDGHYCEVPDCRCGGYRNDVDN